MKKWKKYLRRNSTYFILLTLSVVLVQCDLFNTHIWPEKPPYIRIGDTLIYQSAANVDSFYVEEATLYAPGKTELHWNYEVFLGTILQIDCTDSCYEFSPSIDPNEYRIIIMGIDYYSKAITKYWGGRSLTIGEYNLNDLYRIAVQTDSIIGKEISTVYYSKKYGVVEYELTNGEVFDLDEACITMMEERHK